MIWRLDNNTRIAAHCFPLPIHARVPENQYLGHSFRAANWQSRIRPGDVFSKGHLTCSPSNIIGEFQAKRYLPALALTVSWGGMKRTARYIYRHPVDDIHNTLARCTQSIQETKSIQHSWALLTNELRWSPVIISKALHFLCRALGFEQNPPVPIDNKVILQNVWPAFRRGIPPEQSSMNWQKDGFDGYCRYMTAVIVWAEARHWTTTQVEATIFKENRK
jgi:hypothetical protein